MVQRIYELRTTASLVVSAVVPRSQILSTLKMMAARFSETSVATGPTRRLISEDDFLKRLFRRIAYLEMLIIFSYEVI
jgi:hypothetical protein